MERHQEIRQELRDLYTRSANATHPDVIREYETKINYLEAEAARLLTR